MLFSRQCDELGAYFYKPVGLVCALQLTKPRTRQTLFSNAVCTNPARKRQTVYLVLLSETLKQFVQV